MIFDIMEIRYNRWDKENSEMIPQLKVCVNWDSALYYAQKYAALDNGEVTITKKTVCIQDEYDWLKSIDFILAMTQGGDQYGLSDGGILGATTHFSFEYVPLDDEHIEGKELEEMRVFINAGQEAWRTMKNG